MIKKIRRVIFRKREIIFRERYENNSLELI